MDQTFDQRISKAVKNKIENGLFLFNRMPGAGVSRHLAYKMGFHPFLRGAEGLWRCGGRKGSGALRKVDIMFVMSSGEREGGPARVLR
nr:hypothetical protein [uncultured Desulfobacter sp.]